MSLVLFNDLTRKKEKFIPIKEGHVSFYSCGPTVYDYFHVGNARPFIVFDVLRRWLEHSGYKVTFVQNFTDIDDKMIHRAHKENITVKELAEKFISEYNKDAEALGIRKPDVSPRATEHIPEIINTIEKIIANGHAYVSEGDVYFDIQSWPKYGSLCKQNLEDLEAGARVDPTEKKKDPLDFALWKAEKPGEPSWESPWGKGRPGWHIDCSAMSSKYLGENIDIHSGGVDLMFPHHENEIAQASAMHGNKIANYWMHNAFINFGNEKMSKSLGNVIYAKDMINQYGGPVTRLVILSAHYRQPVNFTEDTVKAATQEINKMQMAYKQMALKLQTNEVNLEDGKPTFIEGFINALADDLNTANALAELYNVLKEANQLVRAKDADLVKLNNLFKTLTDMFYVLGLDIKYTKMSPEDKKLYQDYLDTKAQQNYARSDEIRQILANKGIM